ncbi:proline--tRNA ligase [uncultured Selenomonas sp.]|uniref:proline--tRNA ligase n=1 Tax=uncultured Selenomonas sp. TaxID=159275 RepID=UPI0025E99A9D|nr:proline--tRNA ligase [uncultured Selenomonas sp.]
MRASNLYAPTLRNTPAEAEIVSHQLMYRAGMIRKVAGGMYTFLPLGWRVIRKIEQIIREEMDAAGGQEIMMPILQPGELWQESGRWSAYGAEMMRMKDRHGRDFCLGPTHEEMITDLVRDELHSYKQLPVMLYQIQDKFRDERRPRFGLMRSREFIMKDLYSFDKDPEGMMVSYQKMYDAYSKIYTRMGLEYRPVEADSGAIGGGHSHEFTVLADAGESNIAYCSQCDYAASDEKAELKPETMPTEDALPLEKVSTPGTNTIESLCDFLKIPAEKTIKAVAYQTDTDELVLVFIRGDHDVNEVKVLNQVEGALELRMADEDVIQAAGGCPGFMGPIGIKKGTHVFVDASVMNVQNGVTGANEKDVHYKNVNPQRDFDKDAIVIGDFRMVKEGDPCGTKYSAAMGATFLDEQGKEQPLYMGCYGIGVGRTMAAAIEQNNDKDGIVWPRAIAPFEVVVAVVNAKKDDQLAYGEEIYKECQAAGIDTLLDDRKERAGVKFKDCDLIGYPLRVTIGPKAVEGDTIEIKVRKTGEVIICQRGEYLAKVQELLKNL